MEKMVAVFFAMYLLVFYDLSLANDKWIVVTTIQYPTEQLKTLVQIEGWQLLVVGDKKTPKDWFLEGCIYLSPEDQMSLKYEISSLLPWNHYCRKNIGYLYAIENGAKIIYETDDDNEPIGTLNPLSSVSFLPCVSGSNKNINIYSYFGQSNVWPRGYPLESLKDSKTIFISEPHRCLIGIEQGIVDEEPDVDAIFRLANGSKIIFNKMPSCYIASGTYCPYNSQNTFIHWNSFFTLYLPSFVSMRVADIWRAYIAEKLLQKSGYVLAFSGPNAIQQRNAHSLYHDFLLEADLYNNSGKLVDFLDGWKFPKQNVLAAMSQLYLDLVINSFLQEKELNLINAWLRDLEYVGYSIK